MFGVKIRLLGKLVAAIGNFPNSCPLFPAVNSQLRGKFCSSVPSLSGCPLFPRHSSQLHGNFTSVPSCVLFLWYAGLEEELARLLGENIEIYREKYGLVSSYEIGRKSRSLLSKLITMP